MVKLWVRGLIVRFWLANSGRKNRRVADNSLPSNELMDRAYHAI